MITKTAIRRTGLASAALLALMMVDTPRLAEAQVFRPPRVYTLRLTGEQAWFQSNTHTNGGVQIRTESRTMQMGHPSNPVYVTYYNLQARRLPGLWNYARVEIAIPGGGTRIVSPPHTGAWTAMESVHGGVNVGPPTSVTLTSAILF